MYNVFINCPLFLSSAWHPYHQKCSTSTQGLDMADNIYDLQSGDSTKKCEFIKEEVSQTNATLYTA